MTAEKIRGTALIHFARNGYEGASLADISAEVGIKKQSIYNHFKGKDDLFLAVFQDAAVREMLFVEDYLKRSGRLSLENMLYGFLNEYRKRYEREEDTKFFLRMAFFPPGHLQKEIVEYCNRHLDRTEQLLEPVFALAASNGEMHPDVSIERASAAFTAVLDGMFVEMLYGGLERSLKRLDASWFVYWRGIKNT
ncbi:TetR/AcrR family transcriptional regulator [Paenibacillus mucilaginosus]|uniref:TetR family transcriptional regulator n=2 Tax=Paenibacillus mucilaginosus TaxID=61624 RepID=I0BG38_9BACL|nr:TetR/AcrR family transcriptional regulator [Paenibacillus mucilaginosus]AEI40532.1 Transcriptional regulator, TetR [Paenibacillus mucilaginosus KNP414]AFH61335.1 TetR family transcriptional regulator [Paenibacillus mucilaginosus K02]MCG7216326.1 TetR/AcrR family transcriptional regulator [Paenibacillus mucilaginosus]WDM29699.1 TetR/AcrR family transcriptional regulator [Paenibacillus mucilaginosus]